MTAPMPPTPYTCPGCGNADYTISSDGTLTCADPGCPTPRHTEEHLPPHKPAPMGPAMRIAQRRHQPLHEPRAPQR